VVGEGERYSFGEFVVDRAQFELRRGGAVVPLEPRAFDVLVYLVAHRNRVVTKPELLDEVWGDRFVSESALTTQIRHVRRLLGDDGRSQGYVRTAHGRGYQFVADVVVEDGTGAGAGDANEARHNLPGERTPLFGRETAVDEVAGLLGRHRLVTLLGLGGAGKTRLAAAVGRSVVPAVADGVWFVDLVPADDRVSVDLAIARGCGLALSPGPVAPQLASLLAERDVLLILDNCEHVTDSVHKTVGLLLDRTARVRILATSRAPLGLAGERRVAVERLPVGDDPSSPAVALFVATAERFDVSLRAEDLGVVGQICDRVEGLPLAIELAAGQLRVLTPREVLARLDDPLALLESRDAPGDRHSSVHQVLSSTWQMLEAADRVVLGRMAAFPGEVELSAGEAVSADLDVPVMTSLTRLVDRSLVTPIRSDPPRIRLADTVRRFARDHTDAAANAARHADWCFSQAGTDPSRHLFDFSLAAWCARHVDDVRAAEQHFVATGCPTEAALLTTATALAAHCDAGSHAADVLGRVAGHLDRVDDPSLVTRLHCTGVLAAMGARSPEGIAAHGHAALIAARAAGDPTLEAVALVLASWSTVFRDREAALAMVEEAASLATAADVPTARDHADAYRAFHLAMLRRYVDALDQADAVIARVSSGEPVTNGVFVAMVAAVALRVVDDAAAASRWLEQLLSIPSTTEPMWGNEILASAVHAAAGRPELAAEIAGRVQARAERAGRPCFPDLLLPPAALAHAIGDDERATRWLAAIRHAGRPTQSFQITVAYRRLRDAVGDIEAGRTDAPVDEIGDQALAWLTTMAG
jgi:predicted ATPase/DNA-binding winged helix-turn-helix (wHTH) protein